MDVTLNQLYNGATKKLAVNRSVVQQDSVVTCQACSGQGYTVQIMRMGPMVQQMQQQCARCNGQGKSFSKKHEKEILEVYIERGAPDKHKITFYNKADEEAGRVLLENSFVHAKGRGACCTRRFFLSIVCPDKTDF